MNYVESFSCANKIKLCVESTSGIIYDWMVWARGKVSGSHNRNVDMKIEQRAKL